MEEINKQKYVSKGAIKDQKKASKYNNRNDYWEEKKFTRS